MSELSNFGFYDYTETEDDKYLYTSSEWSTFCQGIVGDGVSSAVLNKFNIDYSQGITNIIIDSGYMFIGGRWGCNTSSTTFSIDAQTGSATFTICGKADIPNRTMEIECDSGRITTSSNTEDIKYLPLYYITVSGSTISKVEDVRIMTYDSVNTVNALNTKVDAAIAENKEYVDNHTYSLSSITGITTGSTAPTSPSVGDIWLYYEA